MINWEEVAKGSWRAFCGRLVTLSVNECVHTKGYKAYVNGFPVAKPGFLEHGSVEAAKVAAEFMALGMIKESLGVLGES